MRAAAPSVIAPIIRFKQVKKAFGEKVIYRDLNLEVYPGETLTVMGGSGVGKSVLLGMMARYTEADVIVVGLIGERGREVKEFIEDILGPEGRARSVVVAAPAQRIARSERIHSMRVVAEIATRCCGSTPRSTNPAARLNTRSLVCDQVIDFQSSPTR